MESAVRLFIAALAAISFVSAEGDFMLIIGGGFHPRDIEIYHPETGQQLILPSPKLDGNGRMYHISSQVNETHILIAGGRDPVTKQRLSSASLLNVKTNEMTPIGETGEQRSGAAAAAVNENIFICGGLEGQKDRRCATNKCEKWNGYGWSYVASLRQDRAIFAMVELNGKLYALGGEINAGPCQESDAYEVLNTVEVYDPMRDQWDKAEPMLNKRYAHAAAVYNGKIWACGGHFDANYDTERMSGCEVFDPSLGKWSLATDTVKPRAGNALLNLNDRLFTIGGAAIPLTNRWFDYDYTPYTLEELNPGNLTWSMHSEFLQHRAYGASVVAVKAHVAPYKNFQPQSAAVKASANDLCPRWAALISFLAFLSFSL